MNIEDNIKDITKKLDIIFEKYSNVPGFNHPKEHRMSPMKKGWGQKGDKNNIYRWCLRYMTGNTGDSSATLVRYMPNEKILYQIICGKPRELINVNKKTSNLNKILDIFEKTIVENIINGRLHKKD